MSNITLQMHKSKSLQVLLTFWATRQALGYPLPVLPAVWELPEASFHHQLEGSCLGLPTQGCSQSPTLSTQLTESQLKTRRVTLLGQQTVEVVSSPQHDPQHGQLCILPADSGKAPAMTHGMGSLFLSIMEEGGSLRRCSLQTDMSSNGTQGDGRMTGMDRAAGKESSAQRHL